MQESRNLWALKDETTPEELEEHVEEMNEIRGMCVELLARQTRNLQVVENDIENTRAALFRAEQRELAGLKRS